MRRPCSEFGQTIVMVTHDPIAAVVRGPRRVPRRRPASSTRCATRPRTRSSTRCANSATEVSHPMWKVTLKGLAAHKLRFLLTGDRRDPRRRVHVGHARAHRRRSSRRSTTCSPNIYAGTDVQVRGHRNASRTSFGGGAPRPPVDSSVARHGARRRRGRGRQSRCGRALRADRRRERQGDRRRRGPADVRVRLDRRSRPEPVPPRARQPAARRRRRDRHRQGQRPTRATSQVGERVSVLTGQASRSTRSSASRSSGRPTASPARRSCCSRCPRRSASADTPDQYGEIGVVATRASPRRSSAHASATATAADNVEVVTGKELTKENQDDIDKFARLLQPHPARLRGRRPDRRRASSSTTRSRSSSRSGRGRWRCSARSAPRHDR